jgi:hypothetical protein
MQGDETKFIVFETISIKDITNQNKASIETDYGPVYIDGKDLRATFLFFDGLRKGNASRNATITSGTMEVSGGSKLNYRSNIQMYENTINSTVDALTEINIHEG